MTRKIAVLTTALILITGAVFLGVSRSHAHPLCPVCQMSTDPATAPKTVYKGKSYYFCSQDHKQQFDAAPDQFVNSSGSGR
jgi:YHS domain-containing protein